MKLVVLRVLGDKKVEGNRGDVAYLYLQKTNEPSGQQIFNELFSGEGWSH